MFKIVEVVIFIALIQMSHMGFLGYLLFRELWDGLRRCRLEAVVDESGVKKESDGFQMDFPNIERLEGGFERSLLFVQAIVVKIYDAGRAKELCLADRDIAKLAQRRMNDIRICSKWNIDQNLISMSVNPNAVEMTVEYTPAGKYAVAPYMMSLLGFPVFIAAIGAMYIERIGLWGFYSIFALFAIICIGLSYYKMSSIFIEKNDIVIKGHDGHRKVISICEIMKVEK